MLDLSSKNQCIEIYKSAFPEPDFGFRERLFEKCSDYIVFLKDEDRVVSFFFGLPCSLCYDNKNMEAVYIFAVATAKEFEGKGYMTRLLTDYEKTADKPLFLRPANKGLEEFYKKRGFSEFIGRATLEDRPVIIPEGKFRELAADYLETNNREFTLMGKNMPICGVVNFAYTME